MAVNGGITIKGIVFHKPFLRIDEITEFFPLSRSRVYELIRNGVFTAHCASGARMKGISIPTIEVKTYFDTIEVPKEKWNE